MRSSVRRFCGCIASRSAPGGLLEITNQVDSEGRSTPRHECYRSVCLVLLSAYRSLPNVADVQSVPLSVRSSV